MAKTFFDSIKKTILTEVEMKTLERDLSFRPACAESAQTLTTAQIEAFHQVGIVLPLPVFDDEEIAKFRGFFDQISDETLASGADSYSVIDPHLNHSKVYDLIFEPRIVNYVRDIIGPYIVYWSTHCICKLPYEKKQVSWHQDAYHWPPPSSSTGRSLSVGF